MEDIASISGRRLITGDFNFHVDDLTDREASIFMDMTTFAGLTQYVTEPSHIDGHTHWISSLLELLIALFQM